MRPAIIVSRTLVATATTAYHHGSRSQLRGTRRGMSTFCRMSNQFIYCLLLLLSTGYSSFSSSSSSFIFIAASSSASSSSSSRQRQRHSSNWAVILSSSRYWFNYQHTINAFSIYQVLKEEGGFDDDHIILLIADEYLANARNPYPNQLLLKGQSLFDYKTTQIDYRGDDVTAETIVNVLLGNGENNNNDNNKGPPVLQSDSDSHVFLYWTGHGGDSFFKFQDVEEIMAVDIASVMRQLYLKGKYRHLLFLADTCQAFTLGETIVAAGIPNITMIGSSLRGESSYSHHTNYDLGLSIIERYTYALTERIKRHKNQAMSETIQQGMVDPYPYDSQRAHVSIVSTHSQEDDTVAVAAAIHQQELRLKDFWVNVQATNNDKKNIKKKNKNIIKKKIPQLLSPGSAAIVPPLIIPQTARKKQEATGQGHLIHPLSSPLLFLLGQQRMIPRSQKDIVHDDGFAPEMVHNHRDREPMNSGNIYGIDGEGFLLEPSLVILLLFLPGILLYVMSARGTWTHE